MSEHHGRLDSFPPYVGGDDDTIDEWQAECACGFRGRKTPHTTVAYGELVEHLNEVLALDAHRVEQAERERDDATGAYDEQYARTCAEEERADAAEAVAETAKLVASELWFQIRSEGSAFALTRALERFDAARIGTPSKDFSP